MSSVALARLDDGTYGTCERVRWRHRRRPTRGDARHAVLHRPRRVTRVPRPAPHPSSWCVTGPRRGLRRPPDQPLLRQPASRRTQDGRSGVGRRAAPARPSSSCGRRMSGPDRRHSVGVARRVAAGARRRGRPRPVLAAALLHDVGKIDARLRHLRAGGGHAVGRLIGRDDDVIRAWTRATRLHPTGRAVPAAPGARRRPAGAGRQRSAHRGLGAGAPSPRGAVDDPPRDRRGAPRGRRRLTHVAADGRRARAQPAGSSPRFRRARASVGAATSRAFAAPMARSDGRSLGVGRQLGVALLDGTQGLDDRLGAGLLEVAVLGVAIGDDRRRRRRGTPPGSTAGSTPRAWRRGRSGPRSSVSVTARLIFLATTSRGSSSTRIVPCGESSDFDIFRVGCWRSITRAPIAGIVASGTTKVSP